jgi:hypothetical protein
MKRSQAPARVAFGWDDDRSVWSWMCRLPHTPRVRPFEDVGSWRETLEALARHQREEHACAPCRGRGYFPVRSIACQGCGGTGVYLQRRP